MRLSNLFVLGLTTVFGFSSTVLAGTPSALKSHSGRDYSHHLRRTDEPFPIRLNAKRGNSIAGVPRTLQVPSQPLQLKRMGGTLPIVARQDLACDPGYTTCSDGGGCCQEGSSCCTEVAMCCNPGTTCCGNACCQDGGVCCGSGCCPSGSQCQTVGGTTGCCPPGQNCDSISGCADSSQVECANENFCCPSGETCGRDGSGNATCNGSTGPATEFSAQLSTPTAGVNTILSSFLSSQSAASASASSSATTSRTGSATDTSTSATQTTTTGAGYASVEMASSLLLGFTGFSLMLLA